MSFMHLRIFVAASAVALTACSTSAQSPRQPSPSDVVATVGSRSFTLAEADALIVRAPNAAAATIGERVEVVPLLDC